MKGVRFGYMQFDKNGKNQKIEYKSVLFVPPTPGGLLAKELRNREEEINHRNKERIKIVEKSGENLENILCKKNPFKTESCTEFFCPICKNGNGEIKMACNTNNVGYSWVCNTCKSRDKLRVYEGETSRSARLRGIEHVKSFNHKRADSVLLKHKILEHENEDVDFEMKITGVFKDVLHPCSSTVKASSTTNLWQGLS